MIYGPGEFREELDNRGVRAKLFAVNMYWLHQHRGSSELHVSAFPGEQIDRWFVLAIGGHVSVLRIVPPGPLLELLD